MNYRYQEYTYGWGSSSYPKEAAQQMKLAERLSSVPECGSVVDVGAGINLTLAAFIGVRRPDVKVMSIDPGYSGQFSERYSTDELDIMIDTFEPCQQLWLRNSHEWRDTMIAGAAEHLPFADESVDMVVSYAVIPEHVWDTSAAVAEAMRILKVGSVAVFGPIRALYSEVWDEALNEDLAAGLTTQRQDHHEVISPWGEDTEVIFSTLIK